MKPPEYTLHLIIAFVNYIWSINGSLDVVIANGMAYVTIKCLVCGTKHLSLINHLDYIVLKIMSH
jgi:hypothetical protein